MLDSLRKNLGRWNLARVLVLRLQTVPNSVDLDLFKR
jgi:hypothetical protein